MTDKKLQELFSTPTGLEPEITISGTTFYSSEKLKDSFILAFKKSSKGKHVYPEISNLVQKNIVIPCYKSKNILSFIKHKLSKSIDKYILGFYNLTEKKVVVIIDNSISIFGTSSNNELISTTLHECMHLAAGKDLSKFVQIFKPYLQVYYSSFFKDYFSLKEKPIDKINKVIDFLTKYEKYGLEYANKDLPNYFKFLYSIFKSESNLNENDFQVRLTNYIVAVKLFIVNMPTLFKNRSKFDMIFTSLNRAYQEAFGKSNKYTTPIQELVSLSEIACVLSEMKSKDPIIKKILNIVT
jgi:nitrate reductase assembly molybdenum cofactor insertion protein NarJ